MTIPTFKTVLMILMKGCMEKILSLINDTALFFNYGKEEVSDYCRSAMPCSDEPWGKCTSCSFHKSNYDEENNDVKH